MKILLVTGGASSEREISLISAKAVKEALTNNGHAVTMFDFKRGYSGMKPLLAKAELVFPVMHGAEGEDGTLYRFLRSSQKPYVGSHPKGARVAFDKILFKRYCDARKIPTARWKIVEDQKDIVHFGFPCVLKGAQGGSSHEVVLLYSKKDLLSRVAKNIMRQPHRCYVERLLKGPEITVGVLRGKALPVIEIVPPKGAWFDYKNKYSGKAKEIPFAPSVGKAIQKKAQSIALKIHKDLDLGSHSRTDFVVENGVPYILETNTPGGVGLTPESLFPKAARAAGIEFHDLVEKMVKI